MITIKVNNNLYQGWETVEVKKDMTSLAHTFRASIPKGLALNISEGDSLQIIDDSKTIMDGYIDIYDISIEETKSPLLLSGRSKGGDLIDCMIETYKQYNNQTPLSIVKDIISPFNISVSTNVNSDRINTFETKVGETFFNTINRLCKQSNILPLSDNNGNIVLSKNINKKSKDILKDKDILKIRFVSDMTGQYSKYTYKKEAIVIDVSDSSVSDTNVKRYRPFVATNTENKNNSDMANWKKNNSQSKGNQLSISVRGWDYNINEIITINSQIIKNSYLIKSISYIKGNEGKISNMVLVDKRLFNV